jgi:hypothetical protein
MQSFGEPDTEKLRQQCDVNGLTVRRHLLRHPFDLSEFGQ